MHTRTLLLAAATAALTMAVSQAATQAPPDTPSPQTAQTPAAPGGRGGRGQGRGAAVFPAQQRPAADPAVVERGRTAYSVACSPCHGVDARGGQLGGPNLLRSQVVLNDQDGELILPIVRGSRASKGMPALGVPEADVRAIAAFLHNLQASAGRQGAPPPGSAPPPDIVVGDAAAGQMFFAASCSACHSATGDLRGIATRIPDPKTLQNLWVSGGAATGRDGRRGGDPPAGNAAVTVTVTMPSGETLEGRLVHIDDFVVAFTQADGRTRSVRRAGNSPGVELHDPLQGHRDLLGVYTEKEMHDVTAYLVTLK